MTSSPTASASTLLASPSSSTVSASAPPLGRATAAAATVAPSNTQPPSTTQHAPCSITAKQWDTVAVWSWDVQSKACAICKGNLADQCISCQAQGPQAPASPSAISLSASSAQARVGSGAAASVAARGLPSTGARGGSGTLSAHATSDSTTPKHATPATLGDLNHKCCVAWGTCGHVFHYHCVSRWLLMHSMCPVCGRPLQLYKITSNE